MIYLFKFLIILEKDTYKTIDVAVGGAVYKEKGSKFIGFAYPIVNENDVKPLISKLKKEHYSARHWCYAWLTGVHGEFYRVNDDGEPHNSAGQPIYSQILSKNITNVLVVVVRYFGGTKLGVGGLVSAYKTAAKLVLEEAKIVEKVVQTQFFIAFDYVHMDKVMRIVKKHKLEIVNQKMEIDCRFNFLVRKNEADMVRTAFENLRCLTIKEMN